jgi:hypothetical protein
MLQYWRMEKSRNLATLGGGLKLFRKSAEININDL